jgi:hypothetical protein
MSFLALEQCKKINLGLFLRMKTRWEGYALYLLVSSPEQLNTL